MHTLLDLRGTLHVASFIHINRIGKLHDVHALDMHSIAGSRSHLRRGSWLRRLCHRLLTVFCTTARLEPSSSRVPSRTSMLIASIRRRRIARPACICDQNYIIPGRISSKCPSGLPRTSAGVIRFKDPESGKTLVFITNNFSISSAATICALYMKASWQVERLLQVDQAASSDQAVLRARRRTPGEVSQIWIAELGLRPRSPGVRRSASTWTPRSTLCYRSRRRP